MVTRDSSQEGHRWTRILCVMGSLLFLLAVSHVAWSEKAPGGDSHLGGKHKAAGIECTQCHQDKPAAPVPTAVCVSCHEDVTKPSTGKEKKPNPHDAHIPFPECASCHHAHKPSENQCGACHDFDMKVP